MKKITLTYLLIMLLSFISSLNAQGLIKEVSLEKQIEKSSLLIEGEVLSKESFWDKDNENIYTVNKIQVHKVFKGESLTTIDIITLGGVVGLKAEIVTPSLSLNVNDIGVFMLNDNNNIELKSKSKKITNINHIQVLKVFISITYTKILQQIFSSKKRVYLHHFTTKL